MCEENQAVSQTVPLQVCHSGSLEDEGAMAKAARQLERLAVEAVAACEAAEAQQLWLLAFEKLTALGSSSKKLIQALLRQLTGMRQGPVRVCLHSPPPASGFRGFPLTMPDGRDFSFLLCVHCYAGWPLESCSNLRTVTLDESFPFFLQPLSWHASLHSESAVAYRSKGCLFCFKCWGACCS